MECPKCQFENPPEARFCMGCGSKLLSSLTPSPRTLSFDEKIDQIQRYLPKGLTEKVLAQRGKIEGERKQVTVMFCDIEGFTPLVEKLGPEKAYSFMDKIYEILIHKVHDYEGTVNEMTGDGIMALFGAPIALEDAPQRALWSALAIHGEIANFNSQSEGIDSISMRIGVHTGSVVVGTLGNNLRVEFKAVGDTVNLASRMEGLAEPGSTCVTEDTYKLAEGIFHFNTMGEKAVKGKESAVQVYKLLSAKKDVHRPRLGFERSIYSEMLGRDKELDRVELQVMKAINGEGSIVNIIGEAGIGKSRLIAELKNRDVIKRVSLFEGRAISTGRNLSFHPIIDLIKQWARIGEDDSSATALRKLETAIRRIAPEEMRELLPFVATLMGMKLSGRYAERIKSIEGEALEKLILKNIRELLIKATELLPLVIVAEDLHWADTSSIEFMESLFRLAESQRVVFVNVFRPGHKETGDRIVETIKERYSSQYVEINLQPLNEAMSEILINNMLNIKGLKHAVIDKIIARADGNPFFIEEVVRSFIDQGAIVPKYGAFDVTEKIDQMVIPYTITDVLLARIDCLEEKTRDLLKIASVIGRSFFYRLLKEMTKTIDDLDNRLSYLIEIQIIRKRKRMDELEYLFKHALAQEAVYNSLLIERRKNLHLRAANSIETVFSERLHEFYGILSYHYSISEDIDKAENYMVKAGREALRSSASNEALYYYQRAMELYINKSGDAADPKKIAEMEEIIGHAFLNKGHFVESVEYFDRSLNTRGITRTKQKPFLLAKCIVDIGIILINLYLPAIRKKIIPSHLDNQTMNRNIRAGMAIAHVDIQRAFFDYIGTIRKCFKFDISESQVYFDALSGGGSLFSVTGISFNVNRRILRYALKSIEDKYEEFDLQFFKFHENLCNFLTGNWREELDETIFHHAISVGDVMSATGYLLWLGNMKLERGDFKNIKIILEKIKDVYDRFSYEHAKLDYYYLYSRLLMKTREIYSALHYANEGIVLVDKLSYETRKMQFLGMKARLQILHDDLSGAKETLDQADTIAVKLGMSTIGPVFCTDYLMGKFIFNLVNFENSINSNSEKNILRYKMAAQKNGKLASKYFRRRTASDRVEVFKLMGILYWIVNRQRKALKWWHDSIKEGERIGAKLELSRVYFEVGKRLREQENEQGELSRTKSGEYIEKARNMFEEMDLRWDLDELDKIAASA